MRICIGLTPSSLALAIRSAFNGTEVTRVQRGRSDRRVMVCVTEGERATRETLDNLVDEAAERNTGSA